MVVYRTLDAMRLSSVFFLSVVQESRTEAGTKDRENVFVEQVTV